MRKSELGNVVAANMAEIIDSSEHKNLFYKQAIGIGKTEEEEENEEHEKQDTNESDTCECSDKCPCGSGGECQECAVYAKFDNMFKDILKMSEDMDDLGFSKSAATMIKMADMFLAEAAGADSIEELMKENPDIDFDMAVIKEQEDPEEPGTVDPVSLFEMEDEVDPDSESGVVGDAPDEEDIIKQLEEIEKGEPLEPQIEAIDGFGKEVDISFKDPKVDPKMLEIPGLEDIEAATGLVDNWLKKYDKKNR